MASSLEGTKILAGVLVAGILAMGTGIVAKSVRHPHMLTENAYKIDTSAVAGAPSDKKPSGPAPVEPVLALLAAAKPADGEQIGKKCAACHSFEKGGPNKVGPHLWGVVGRDKGHAEGFAYSDGIKNFPGADKTWSYTELNHFLADPKGYVPGTKMTFAGLKKASERAAMIAYLRTLADSPAALPTDDQIKAEAAAAAGG